MYYITGIIACAILLIATGLYQGRRSFDDREIKGPITLSSEWIEITPDKPLKPEREYQQIVLSLSEPFLGDFEAKGVRLLDGSIITPQVQLVDQNGDTFDLKYGGFRGRMNIYYSNFDQLPKDREYRTVRIRSEKPINCKRILWSCYYQRDLN